MKGWLARAWNPTSNMEVKLTIERKGLTLKNNKGARQILKNV